MVRNVHERRLAAPPGEVGGLLDTLASTDDRLWPVPAWPRLALDRPLGPGASGGHGPVRYAVEVHEPGRLLRFRFAPAVGADGTHTFRVEPDGRGGTLLQHDLEARLHGRMRVVWPLVVRWLHDALLEDLLDRAETAVTGSVARPARWSPWVRFLRWSIGGRRSRGAAGHPHVVAEAEATVPASADEVLGLLLDPARYRAVDPRLHRIHWVRRRGDGNETLVRFTPRLGPLPAVLRSTQRLVLDPGHSVTITPEPSWTDALVRFRGSLTCEPVDDGVRVRRRLEFWLAWPLRMALGGVLRRWLADDVPAELDRLRTALTRDPS